VRLPFWLCFSLWIPPQPLEKRAHQGVGRANRKKPFRRFRVQERFCRRGFALLICEHRRPTSLAKYLLICAGQATMRFPCVDDLLLHHCLWSTNDERTKHGGHFVVLVSNVLSLHAPVTYVHATECKQPCCKARGLGWSLSFLRHVRPQSRHRQKGIGSTDKWRKSSSRQLQLLRTLVIWLPAVSETVRFRSAAQWSQACNHRSEEHAATTLRTFKRIQARSPNGASCCFF